MKLFFYIPTLKTGGAEKQCSLVATELKKKHGYDIEIITTHPSDKTNSNFENLQRVASAQIPVHVFAWYRLADLWNMFKLFRANRDSVIISYMTFPNFFGGLIGRLARVKAVFGGVRTERLPPRFMAMEYIAHYLFTKATIFNSWRAYECFVKKGFIRGRSLVISNAIEPSGFVQRHDAGSETVRIITVGTFNESKDYKTWLEVVKGCRGAGNVEAVIIGYGILEGRIKDWISELRLDDVVRLLPGNNGRGIPEALSKADIYLNTSIREGTSNSILEAMRAGLPVVATDVGDNARLITDGYNGFVTEAKDVGALTARTRSLIVDRMLRRCFGVNSRIRIASDYSIVGVLSQYQKLLESVECT